MVTRTAIVFGATGLIGRSLIDELSIYDTYNLIKVFVRKKTDFSGVGKIREYPIDFSNLNEYSEMITGDDLYICLGTTLKKAGSCDTLFHQSLYFVMGKRY
jgi:NAD dependent epimerase/dehydratase family enzyme